MNFPRHVYAIQHNITGRIYVGSSTNVSKRYRMHMALLRNGKHTNTGMQEDFNAFGENFTLFILDIATDNSQRSKEYDWMCKLRTNNPKVGYNSNDPYFRGKSEVPFSEGIPIPNDTKE